MTVQTVNRPAVTATHRQTSAAVTAGVVVASAVAGGLAGVHPTGTAVVDPLYGALLAGTVTLATSAAGRLAWLWLATVAAAMSRGLLIAPAAAGLLTAAGGCFTRRPRPVIGALSGALAVQVVLRWPPVAFHGATALLAAAAVLPGLIAALVAMSASRRRWFLYLLGAAGAVVLVLLVPTALSIVSSRGQLSGGIAATDSALAALRQGEATAGTAQLSTAASDFRAASRSVGSWWTLGTRVVPVAAQQRQAVVAATRVAAQVATVAGVEARSIDFSSLRLHGGGINLREVSSFRKPLQAVTAELSSAAGQIHGINSPWLLAPLRSRVDRLYSEVDKARTSATLADQAVTDAPSLLGGDGPRRYFIGLLDTSESRGLGGLLVWYGMLDADNGRLSLGQFGDAVNLGSALAARGGGHLSGPADYLSRYGSFRPQNTFIDVPYAPDLPTVTDVVSQLYAELGHRPIDGMIILDPRSLASVLDLVGSVDVQGIGVLNGSNAARFFETGQYALYPDPGQQVARKQALYRVMQQVSDRLVSGSLPGPRVLAQVLGPDVRTGDLAVWSRHPQDQPLLLRTGLADAFPKTRGGDLLAVVTQNAANNKIDAYLQRVISDQVSFDRPTGGVVSTVNVSLTNQAPAKGLSYQVIDSYPGVAPPGGLHLPVGTNLTWMTVYSPLSLVSASAGTTRLAMTSTPELGVNAYSGYVEIPPGGTVTVTLHLRGSITRGRPYRLAMYQQPMVHPDRVEVAVAGAGGAGTQTWRPADSVTAFRIFRP